MTIAQAIAKARSSPAQGNAGAFNQTDETVAVSQNFGVNDFAKWSSGTLAQALALPGSNNTATTSAGTAGLVGPVQAPIITASSGIETTTGRTTTPVIHADQNSILTLPVWNATVGSANPAALTVGNPYNLARVRGASASEWGYFVSSASPTNGEFIYLGPDAETSTTETYGLGRFRPILNDTYWAG